MVRILIGSIGFIVIEIFKYHMYLYYYYYYYYYIVVVTGSYSSVVLKEEVRTF